MEANHLQSLYVDLIELITDEMRDSIENRAALKERSGEIKRLLKDFRLRGFPEVQNAVIGTTAFRSADKGKRLVHSMHISMLCVRANGLVWQRHHECPDVPLEERKRRKNFGESARNFHDLLRVSADMLKSVRNMGFPMPPGWVNRALRELSDVCWGKMDRIVILNPAFNLYTRAAAQGEITAGRKACQMMRDKPERLVCATDLEIQTEWRDLADFSMTGKDFVDFSDPRSWPVYGGIPCRVMDDRQFLEKWPEFGKDRVFGKLFE